MSPLFPCSRCGVQIERSVRLYRQQKGLVLCSTCKDRQEEADQQGAARTAVNHEADPGAQ